MKKQKTTPRKAAAVAVVEERKTLAYKRVSTERQELERQAWLISRWLDLAGVTLTPADWLEDDGISGRANATKGASAARGDDLVYYAALCTGDYLTTVERPGFLNLLRAVEDGGYTRVVVASLDRLSRDTIELLLLERKLRALSCELVTVSTGGACTTQDAAGFLKFTIDAVIAEYECRQTGDRTRQSLAAKQAAGVVLGRPPAGWTKLKGENAFAPDPVKWVDVVRVVWARQAGLTREQVCRVVPRLKTKNAVGRWEASYERRLELEFRWCEDDDTRLADAAGLDRAKFRAACDAVKTENGRFPGLATESGPDNGKTEEANK